MIKLKKFTIIFVKGGGTLRTILLPPLSTRFFSKPFLAVFYPVIIAIYMTKRGPTSSPEITIVKDSNQGRAR